MSNVEGRDKRRGFKVYDRPAGGGKVSMIIVCVIVVILAVAGYMVWRSRQNGTPAGATTMRGGSGAASIQWVYCRIGASLEGFNALGRSG